MNIPCDYEILIGDDGSDDGTRNEIDKWIDWFGERLYVYTAEREDGNTDAVVRVSNLRKELLKRATGEYYLIMDGDDYYSDNEFIVDALNMFNNNLALSMVMFNYEKVSDKKVIEINTGIQEGSVNKKHYIRNCYTHAGACVYKKIEDDIFLKRIDNALYYDDNDILIYHMTYGEAWYINKSVYAYRQTDNSLWKSKNRSQQGVLNVLGADNEVYLAPEFADDIYYRYRKDILFSIFRGEDLIRKVGEEFFSVYRELSLMGHCLMGKYITGQLDEEKIRKVDYIIALIQAQDEMLYYRIKRECEQDYKI